MIREHYGWDSGFEIEDEYDLEDFISTWASVAEAWEKCRKEEAGVYV